METSAKTAMNVNEIFLAIGKFDQLLLILGQTFLVVHSSYYFSNWNDKCSYSKHTKSFFIEIVSVNFLSVYYGSLEFRFCLNKVGCAFLQKFKYWYFWQCNLEPE
jgi:hypothetical protein